MISVEEAKNIVDAQRGEWGVEWKPIDETIGEVLAEDIVADRDFPPFDRVAMDGIALSFDPFDQGQREFRVQETQLAGAPAVSLRDKNHVVEIMTGAVLCSGCDFVVRYEDLNFSEREGEKWVTIDLTEGARWKNIHRQGSDEKAGATLIKKGKKISAAEVAIMATVGHEKVKVNRKPKIAIISTGDELVDVSITPAPHQIRKSNTVAIKASLTALKVKHELFHLTDDKEVLTKEISIILNDFDVILMSGGVSKGKADFLPEVLASLGVVKKFHRVAQKPGKPFWFGISRDNKAVFAFPGNPISTYMCYCVYFLPWLISNVGINGITKKAKLMESFSFKGNLGYFLQVRTEIQTDNTLQVFPQTGNGSGDLANLSKSDAFIYLPNGQDDYNADESFDYFSFNELSLA